jgi:hypothetical protein
MCAEKDQNFNFNVRLRLFLLNHKNSHCCIEFHRLIFRLEWVRSAAGNPFIPFGRRFYFAINKKRKKSKFIAMAEDVLNSSRNYRLKAFKRREIPLAYQGIPSIIASAYQLLFCHYQDLF